MPKKKIYQTSLAGMTYCAETGIQESGGDGAVDVIVDKSADIDMVQLLGEDARFTGSARKILFSSQLNRGIDEWIYATAHAIRSLLLGGQATITAASQRSSMMRFFDFLTEKSIDLHSKNFRPGSPKDLKPQHIEQFIAWRKNYGLMNDETPGSTRTSFQNVKTILVEMLKLELISGEYHQFFRRGVFTRDGESMVTSFSEKEQERIAIAVKSDLSAVHHGRLEISHRELQALRFLVVAHRLGHNTTPLLELRRDAMRPGVLPGTILLETLKRRNLRIDTQIGREGEKISIIKPAPVDENSLPENKKESELEFLPFSFAEGAVINQAIVSTEHLISRAPNRIKNRVWLYESIKKKSGKQSTTVSALSPLTVFNSLKTFVARHNIVGDDGSPMAITTSRFRKSRFDRAFRIADGDISVTANLMGNTPQVASINYPSMNLARQVEANDFMDADYIESMRSADFNESENLATAPSKMLTPIGVCADSVGGEHAPKTGSHCDRFVMCLFCSSFAVMGTVDELWKLFSFQIFAQLELNYLEKILGPESSGDLNFLAIEELRDRYRLAVPFIDSFTKKQFAASRVKEAREKAKSSMHPFWKSQVAASRRARFTELGSTETMDETKVPPEVANE
ncbi:hypothetical protein LJR066_003776 [Acidovorax sp. LjRoot66]|uniref:hypothetical protein n=1 Tax=Acidovorax sp. LjRoot66 TaxID=3342334 RepID=UPI003ED093E8